MAFESEFEKDVVEGLSREQKSISSKYFYDETGDKIFQEIMQMDEYYLPESELNILKNQSHSICQIIPFEKLDVIELGAGDGTKTVHLLKDLVESGKSINYIPMDISPDVLRDNKNNIQKILPNLVINGIAGDYFSTLEKNSFEGPKVFLFMGSNIGNFKNEKAIDFLRLIHENMDKGDILFVAIDLKKSPRIIMKAYDDPHGITSRFNLNLLNRINQELGANIDIKNFEHYAYYEPISGVVYSYLISLKKQSIKVGKHTINFEANEPLHTEVSQKYNLADIKRLKEKAGFEKVEHFIDENNYYSLNAFFK